MLNMSLKEEDGNKYKSFPVIKKKSENQVFN